MNSRNGDHAPDRPGTRRHRWSARPIKSLALRALGAAVGDPNLARDFGVVEADLEARLESVLSGARTVVVGPWMSEVGFEVLYWIPFLRWVHERFSLDSSRVVVVSRGGTRSWYEGICDDYVDIFEHIPVGEFRELTEARWASAGGQKQGHTTRWEEIVLRRLAPAIGPRNSGAVLHPAFMYQAFREYWLARGPIETVLSRVRFDRFPIPPADGIERDLPAGGYAAVKFYFRPSFPDTLANRRFVESIVRSLAARRPVVLLNTGLEVDEHVEYEPGLVHEVHRAASRAEGVDNLAVQTAILARASTFVGTYGGLSYLASALGVPAVGFWSQPDAVKPEHLQMGWRASQSLGAPLSGLDVGDAEMLGWLEEAGRAKAVRA
jgi:hypothetical protein